CNWVQYRRTLSELSNLSNATLNDIGVSRHQIRAIAARSSRSQRLLRNTRNAAPPGRRARVRLLQLATPAAFAKGAAMTEAPSPLHIVGGGLAGSEAAWQIARRGIPAIIHEMRGLRVTDAHRTDKLGELVCSNSFRSDDA